MIQVQKFFGGAADRWFPIQPPRSLVARWAQLLAGFFVFAVAIVLMLRADLGLGPWDAFHVGLHLQTGMSVGMASIVAGLVIVLGTLLIGVRPGLGTLANMVVIGLFVDLLLPWMPVAEGWSSGLLYFLTGVALCGVATGMYIAAGLGKGPRDGLMVGLSQRTGWPVRRVRLALELSVLALGWLMGGKIGVGTLIFTATIGNSAQWGLQLFNFSATGEARAPRSAVSSYPSLPGRRPGERSAHSSKRCRSPRRHAR
jgi:uncharacterized protein